MSLNSRTPKWRDSGLASCHGKSRAVGILPNEWCASPYIPGILPRQCMLASHATPTTTARAVQTERGPLRLTKLNVVSLAKPFPRGGSYIELFQRLLPWCWDPIQ